MLVKAGLQTVILNARQDGQEAEIVAGAGQPGRVTVATNMAGRGTDIQLHPDVRDAGGLHVILTEYHESRRIDRQLFGRAGRQGDPGSYESIVALDDELFERFAGKRLLRIVTNGVRLTKKVPPIIGRALRGYSQSRAERQHERTRRMTLAEDHRWNKSSWFRGHGMIYNVGHETRLSQLALAPISEASITQPRPRRSSPSGRPRTAQNGHYRRTQAYDFNH